MGFLKMRLVGTAAGVATMLMAGNVCFASPAMASVEPAGAAVQTSAQHGARGRHGGVELAQFGRGKGLGSSAFKPDPIYGGGRGRDPYGSPLEADPYKPGGVLKERASRPPNAVVPRDRPRQRREREQTRPSQQRRNMSPEDQAQENRSNRRAQQEGSSGYDSE